MHRTLEGYLDTLLLVFMMAINVMFSTFAVNNVRGVTAAIGNDKVVVATDTALYEEPIYYVKDLIMSLARSDILAPISTFTATYNSNSISHYMKDLDVLGDRSIVPKEVMSLKPSSMSVSTWYNLPIKTVLTIDSATKQYNFDVTIGG